MSGKPLLFRRAASAVQFIDLADIASAKLDEPFEKLIYPLGEVQGHDDRKWFNDAEDLDAIEQDLADRAKASEVAAMLYNHKEDGRGAGFVVGQRRAEEGLYLKLHLSVPAAQSVRDREYLFLSPKSDGFLDKQKRFHPRRLVEVSLVPLPGQKLGPVIQAAATTGDVAMEEQIAQLRSRLGMPETATPEEVLAACLTAMDTMDAAKAKAKADEEAAAKAAAGTKVEEKAATEAAAQVRALEQRVDRRFAALEHGPKMDKLFADALDAGKNIPPEDEKKLRVSAAKLPTIEDALDHVSTALKLIPAGTTPEGGRVTRAAGLDSARKLDPSTPDGDKALTMAAKKLAAEKGITTMAAARLISNGRTATA